MGQSVLSVEPALLREVAARVGTPVYVYHAEQIRHRYRALHQALAGIPHRIHYSVKANANLAVLALVRELGAGADIVSGGELVRALRAGFQAADLVFSGVGKTPAELRAAVDAGVGLINLESQGELAALAALVRGRPQPQAVGIRVNPDVGTATHPYTQTGQLGKKFGVPWNEVPALAQQIAREPGLVLQSVAMHLGSQIADAQPYRAGAERLAAVIEELRHRGVDTLTSVDVGGGLGISYGCEPALDLEAFAAAIEPLWRRTGLPVLVEPGRFLVGHAGYLLTRVLYWKRSGDRQFAVTDAGMNDLLRPALYQAYHEIRVIEPAPAGAPDSVPGGGTVDVVGPNCESGDFLGLDRMLPGAGPGALLAVLDAGAYGFGMSFPYNSRPRAAEVLLEGGRYAVVRERETVEDLLKGETAVPRWEAW